MTAVINRLPDVLAKFEAINSAESWSITGGTLDVSGESGFKSGYLLGRVSIPVSTANITTSFIAGGDDSGRQLIMSMFVRCHVGGVAGIRLSDTYGNISDVNTVELDSSNSRQNPGTLADGGWTVVRSAPLQLQDVGIGIQEISIDIEISPSNVSNLNSSSEPYVYIAIPAVYGAYDFQINSSAESAYFMLPQVMRDYEKSGSPDYPLYRLLDVLNYANGIASDYLNRWTYVDFIDGYDGTNQTKSYLVDPTVAPITVLPWLNQFVGSPNIAGTSTSTPWASIPPTWTAIEAQMDENLDTIVSWDEFETYAPSFANSENTLRWQSSTGYAGLNAGSLEAIEEAVKFVLTGDKWVEVVQMEHYIDSTISGDKLRTSWEIEVKTYVSETPDVNSISDVSALVTGIINQVKPIGIKVIHTLVA